MRDMYDQPNRQPVSRVRRAAFVFTSFAFCLGMSSYLVLSDTTGPLATVLVEGLIQLAITLVIFYLGASVVDRSDVLGRMGDGFSRRSRYRLDSNERFG